MNVTVGLLHPGQMGAAVGREAVRAGARVLWCPDGRGAATAERAAEAGLTAMDLPRMVAESDVVISLCPPAAAEEVAGAVREAGFGGVFVEANAIGTERMRRIAREMPAATVVDGCVIGPPPGGAVSAHLYLCGTGADRVAAVFDRTGLGAFVLDGEVGAASALKMAYGSYQKASSALAAVSVALAGVHGVREPLLAEARRTAGSALADLDRLPGVAARAWRWAPEMREAADTMADAGLPGDLALAAAAVFELWKDDKDSYDADIDDVLARLRRTAR